MDTIAERYEDDTRSAVESEAFELNDSDERPASPRTEGFFQTAQELFICTGNWSRLRWANAHNLCFCTLFPSLGGGIYLVIRQYVVPMGGSIVAATNVLDYLISRHRRNALRGCRCKYLTNMHLISAIQGGLLSHLAIRATSTSIHPTGYSLCT
jgi:hypothetical protein